MARQVGPIFLRGTYDGVHFYERDGKYYVRMQSTLAGHTVKTSPRFKNTMKFAQMMACSSKIGSVVFKALPVGFKESWMYRAFVGEAMDMFKQMMAYEEVFAVLWRRYAAEFQERYDEMEGFVHMGVMEEVVKADKQPAMLVIKECRMFVSMPHDCELPELAHIFQGAAGGVLEIGLPCSFPVPGWP